MLASEMFPVLLLSCLLKLYNKGITFIFQQYDMVDDGAVDEFEKQRPSRKQKSLGLLCQKFLARYPSYPLSAEKSTISLDEVASSLGMYA